MYIFCIVLYFVLHLSVPRFTTREQREALAEWLDWVAAKEDVWFVTGTQTLLWMTDPTPLNRLNSFEPWQCEDKPVYLHYLLLFWSSLSDWSKHSCNIRLLA